MVKRSRDQSSEAPSRRSWRVMVPPLSFFHSHTRAMKSSRDSSLSLLPFAAAPRCRPMPFSANWRSTTIWVAMPAWSVPGIHRASKPFMRL